MSGVFGVVAYVSESRRREMGLRVSLGATVNRVLWQLSSAGLRPVIVGTALGTPLAGVVAKLAWGWLGRHLTLQSCRIRDSLVLLFVTTSLAAI